MKDPFQIVNIIENFFSSNFFDYVLKGILIYLGALWIAIIVWVARDSINRSNSLIFQTFVICLNIVLPVFGLILYLIIRPPQTLIEKFSEDLEYQIETDKRIIHCPYCDKEVDDEFLYCPYCTKQVKKKCARCHKVYDVKWSLCPFCGIKNQINKEKEKKKKLK